MPSVIHSPDCAAKFYKSFPQISLLDFYFEKLTLIPAPEWLHSGWSVIHCNISVQECWLRSQAERAVSSGWSAAAAVLGRTVTILCQESKIENYPQVMGIPVFSHHHHYRPLPPSPATLQLPAALTATLAKDYKYYSRYTTTTTTTTGYDVPLLVSTDWVKLQFPCWE